jgi:ribosome biogenesis GTPase / thiamine phosphate phosphatase
LASVRDWGFDSTWQSAFDALGSSWQPGRVIGDARDLWRVAIDGGEVHARLAGRLRHDGAAFPAVGDWVALDARLAEGSGTIQAILPRRTRLSRKAAGRETAEQVVAANVDVVFVTSALDRELEPRRVERWLALVWESGARPVLVLNKADRLGEGLADPHALDALAAGAPVVTTSAQTGDGVGELLEHVRAGETAAFVGSSGVGKSTLINRLLGEATLATGETRADDDRGRHTTTSRRIVRLPGGALVVDTPGLREVGLWAGEDALGRAFEDVEALAAGCRFRDCRHEAEPGCAVRRAVGDGSLDAARLESFKKLQREVAHLARKTDVLARLEHEKQWKRVHRQQSRMYRERDKRGGTK